MPKYVYKDTMPSSQLLSNWQHFRDSVSTWKLVRGWLEAALLLPIQHILPKRVQRAHILHGRSSVQRKCVDAGAVLWKLLSI